MGRSIRWGWGGRRDPERQERTLRAVDAFRDAWGKPVLMVCAPGTNLEAWQEVWRELVAHGYAVYASFDRAAQAYARSAWYWGERLSR